MRPERGRGRWPLLVLMGLPVAWPALADIEAGQRRFCVPNADRSGWECSEVQPAAQSADAPPEAAAAAPAESSPPPSMLAAPPEQDAAPLSDFYRVVPDTEPDPAPLPETVLSEPQSIAAEPEPEPQPEVLPEVAAPEPEPEPEPVVLAEPEPPAEPVPETPPAPEPEPVPAFLAAPEAPEPLPSEAALPETDSVPEPAPEPEPEPEPVVAAEPAAPPVPEPAVAPEPEPVAAPASPEPVAVAPPPPVPAPPAAGRTSLAMLAGARDFSRLDGNAYTLQLADAASPAGFPALVDQLGLSPAQCYLLRVKRDGQAWWLLAHGQFGDASQAKAALARLPSVPGLSRNWPRKIQYLQREFDPLGP